MIDKLERIDLLVETSWEVCNKVGGIYTVLSSKAKVLHKLYRDRLVFIGPDVWTAETPSPFFTEQDSPLDAWKSSAILPEGVSVRTGRWNIPGHPLVILVKFDAMYAVKDQLYAEMWNYFGVDSLHAYGDYDEACAFSHAAGLVLESLVQFKKLTFKNVIAHFNEWTTGMALLYTRLHCPSVATVFTTHATSIGRSICGNNKPLYDYFEGYNGDQMADELNMQSKHSLEKAAAHNADCFTTVSEVTARECTQLLDITPHVVTPNGFEPDFVPAKSRFNQARKAARMKLAEVTEALYGIKVDDNAMFVATSGRCEFRNKGIDVFLDAVNRIKANHPDRQIIAFVMVPAWSDKARKELVDRLGSDAECGLPLDDCALTHSLHNRDCDVIINRINQLGLNSATNNVSVVYVPCYLNGSDGVFNMSYYDLLPGIDLTVFPSYYEPWGYTPLESIAFHVPTVTTSLSGFGQWIASGGSCDIDSTGVEVIERNDSNYNNVCDAIASTIMKVAATDANSYNGLSDLAFSTSVKAQWPEFIPFYQKTFEIALLNRNKRVGSNSINHIK